MSKVMLDESLYAKLKGVREEMEICDESGRTLGHFVPENLYRRLVYDWANAQITDEELQRRLREPGGKTLNNIWARLKDS